MNLNHILNAGNRYRYGQKEGADRSTDKNRMSVKCVETGEIFNSLTDAAKSVGGLPGTLSTYIRQEKKYKGKTFIKTEQLNK